MPQTRTLVPVDAAPPQTRTLTAVDAPPDYTQTYRLMNGINGEEGRKQGAEMLARFTPEQRADYEREAKLIGTGLRREDNSVAGMPPELAVAGGIGMVRAAPSILGAGLSMGQRAMGAARVAGPIVAGEGVRAGLQAVGLPPWLSRAAGFAVAGRAGGGRGVAAEMTAAERAALAERVPAGWGGKTSGVPDAGSVVPSPRTGSVSVPSRPVNGSGVPTIQSSAMPRTGSVEAPTTPVNGSGVPLIRVSPMPRGGAIEAPNRLTPAVSSGSGVPSKMSTAPIPRGGSVTAPSRPTVAYAPKAPAANGVTRAELSSDESAAMDGLLKEGHSERDILATIAAHRLAALIKARIGGG